MRCSRRGSAEVRAILDSSYGLKNEISSRYECICTRFIGEEAHVTPAGEFGDMLRCQAVRMRNLLETLTQAVELLYRDYGGRGRMWRGVQEALQATESDPASPVIVKAFEYACAVCHALESLEGGALGHAEQLSDEFSSESRWCQLVWHEVVRLVSSVESEAPVSTVRWARLGVAGLRYVDTAERLRCIAEECPFGASDTLSTDAGSLRLVAREPQRVWGKYYMAIEADDRLTGWLGESAYVAASEEGIEVWPERVYLDKLGGMVVSLDGGESHRTMVSVSSGIGLCMPHELSSKAARSFFPLALCLAMTCLR